ncbi:GNAT family N-acetyltransferase [Colwellia sp. BRX9-1]|uniref:GNAT family N-acetyltransferase n=1 Tax=Colwellia sp. BRX9-1 TaxID=2759830 RepID=UPI0015F63C12|nr:GNAT family N-acetyltransferase [Colwellia sp. BRX9-1]MBA6352045.1 N-acetyltransferase [Colwellia sp. BRX9-1]
MNADININFLNHIDKISAIDWQALNNSPSPFLAYEFFSALEKSDSVSVKQGWQAHHLVTSTNGDVTGVMPMYLKSHSWGEYVFDWDWAEAYQRNEINYYPKLVATIPFTPVTSNKFLSEKLQINELFAPLIEHCQQENINSWHILYCDEIKTVLPADIYQRNTVQFHWFNRDYKTFDDFLGTFTSRKRKNTRKERLSITQQDIKIRQLKNSEISRQELDFFYLTYQLTYLKRGHQPHLSYDFFKQIVLSMTDNILLIIASHQQEDIACALFFYDDTHLYGRYWGCTKHYNNLHFELCYYRGIEFCIEHNLQVFNPGTQGEHKIQRGFEPTLTYSYHWIKHPAFKAAIKNFCHQEQQHMLTYQQQCQQALPFKTLATNEST